MRTTALAMITAYLAASYNREVAAFPGRVYDTRSGGPNKLIRKNIASLITGPQDLLELMRIGAVLLRERPEQVSI